MAWACGGDEKGNIYPTPSGPGSKEEPRATETIKAMPSETAPIVPTRDTQPPPPAPTATPSPEVKPSLPQPTATPEVRRDLAMFNFGEDVPENLRAEIINGANIGLEWILNKTGVNLAGLNVHAYGSLDRVVQEYYGRRVNDSRTLDQIRTAHAGSTAFAGDAKNFYVITSSPGWTTASPIPGGPVVEGRYHTIFHELYHSLQWQVNGYAGPPPVGWLNEGGAHYIAARALDENTIGGKKIFPFDDIKARHLRQAVSSRSSLQGMEAAFNGDYSLAFMALDLLLRDKPDGGVGGLTTYWKEIGKGSGPDAAFLIAFGIPKSEFYIRSQNTVDY